MQNTRYRLTEYSAARNTIPYFTASLAPRVTVFLGRNGAGKSVLLEALASAPAAVLGLAQSPGSARELHMLGWTAAEEPPATYVIARTSNPLTIHEHCLLAKQQIWQVEDGVLTSPSQVEVALSANAGLLATTALLPAGLSWLRPSMQGLRFVPAGVPRSPGRTLLFLSRPKDGGESAFPELVTRTAVPPLRSAWQATYASGRLARLAEHIAGWLDSDPAKWQELSTVLRRVDLPHDWALVPWENPHSKADDDDCFLRCTGIDVGLLSDGTLRALEILVALVDDATSILLIEEPETAIHPGLLGRLLAEFDAYADDKQIIVSTHSPQVVSWARPDELRLVQWQDNHPTVRALSAAEAGRAAAYLADQGDLGEFVYDGGLDE